MISNKEIARRLSSLSAAELSRGYEMARDGFSASGISLNSPLSLKQANAIFAWMDMNPKMAPAVDMFQNVGGAL